MESKGAKSHEQRSLDLLVQASRTDPKLRAAVAEVEKWVRRLQEDRSSAWQSYEEADTEAQWQMGAKLEAQQALWLIVKALDLNPAELPAGWSASTRPILARIDAIVDEAERAFRERDTAREALESFADPYSWHANYDGSGIIFQPQGAYSEERCQAYIDAAKAALKGLVRDAAE